MPNEEADDIEKTQNQQDPVQDENPGENNSNSPTDQKDHVSDKDKIFSEESIESATSILGDIVKRSKETIDEQVPVAEPEPVAQDEAAIKEFQETMGVFSNANQETQDDPMFLKMKSEYEKIHGLFVQSRKNEKALMKKCRELTQELNSNASKVLAALKLSQNDRITISSLKKEAKKAWEVVESLNEREERSKEAISSLKVEVESLKTSLNESGLTASIPVQNNVGFGKNRLLELQMEQETTIRHLKSDLQRLQERLDSSNQEAQYLTVENTTMEEKIQALIDDKFKMDEEILNLKDLLSAKKSENDRESRAREKLESALKQANDSLAKRDAEMALKAQESKSIREQMIRVEAASRDDRIKAEKLEQEKDHVHSKNLRIQQDYEEQTQTILRLMNENNKYVENLDSWKEEVSKQKDEFKMISRARDSLTKRLKVIEDAKSSAEVERDVLKATNASLNHSMEMLQKESDTRQKQIDSLTRERDVALKNVVKASGATQKQFNIVKLSEQTHRNLEQEISGFKDEAAKMRKLIFSLEKERDIKIAEAASSYENYMKKDEELKLRDLIIFDSKKKIIELERKMKEQQLMYESVRTDRNMYSKNLLESQDEVIEMKRKLKIMSHQIEQLKEEIATKENALIKEHFEHTKLEKEKESLSSQIARVQYQFEESQQMIQNQEAEEEKLRHIISEADLERLRQKKEFANVIQERDILGTQLIRRNDELSLLYEKIKIQASTLNKGEIQYRERVEDIRVLKLEIKKLRREKAILQTETQNVQSLRSEIFRLQREVLRERTRVKVLEEELESPMNIHRWRKLSGSDPSTFELITKIQTLQKRLIAKTEDVVEKELVIQQKEKLYKDIKEVLQRQPGPEVIEELRIVKEAVKVKVRESKALASELNMYQSQINEYKFEIERLNREIQDLKKKYFEQRKKLKADSKITSITERMKEKLGTAAFERLLYTPAAQISYNVDLISKKSGHMVGEYKTINPQLPTVPKFSGGGFNMSATTHIHPNNPANISRPVSSFAGEGPTVSGISGKEIQQAVDDRGDSAAIQVPQAVTEMEAEADERSQNETSIAV